MAIRFACPGCQRTLNVPDQYAGRQSKCPGCSTPVMVPAANGAGITGAPNVSGPAGGSWLPPGVGQSAAVTTSPAAAPQWNAPAAGGFGSAIAPQWSSVATGLKLMRMATTIKIVATIFYLVGIIATVLLFGAAVASLVPRVQGSGGQPSNAAAGAGVVMLVVVFGVVGIFLVALLAQYVLQVIGGFITLGTPPESGAKGLAIGVVVCLLVPIGSFFIRIVDALATGGSFIGAAAAFLQLIAIIVEWVLFVMFMHCVGTSLDSSELRSRAVNFGIWLGATFAGSIMATCIIGIMVFMSFASLFGAVANAAAPDGTREAAQGFGALGIIAAVIIVGTVVAWLTVGLVTLIKYFGMMNSGISTIRQRLAGAAVA